MNKIQKESSVKEKIDSLVKKLEVYDIKSSISKSIENLLNWFIAIGSGFYLAVFSNTNNLLIDNKIPFKRLFLLSLFFVAIGLLITTALRLILLYRDVIISSSNAFINKTKYKIEEGSLTKKDLDKFDRQLDIRINILNKPDLSTGILRTGTNSLALGVAIFVVYYFVFVILCL